MYGKDSWGTVFLATTKNVPTWPCIRPFGCAENVWVFLVKFPWSSHWCASWLVLRTRTYQPNPEAQSLPPPISDDLRPPPNCPKGFSHRQAGVRIFGARASNLTWRPMESIKKMVQSILALRQKFDAASSVWKPWTRPMHGDATWSEKCALQLNNTECSGRASSGPMPKYGRTHKLQPSRGGGTGPLWGEAWEPSKFQPSLQTTQGKKKVKRKFICLNLWNSILSLQRIEWSVWKLPFLCSHSLWFSTWLCVTVLTSDPLLVLRESDPRWESTRHKVLKAFVVLLVFDKELMKRLIGHETTCSNREENAFSLIVSAEVRGGARMFSRGVGGDSNSENCRCPQTCLKSKEANSIRGGVGLGPKFVCRRTWCRFGGGGRLRKRKLKILELDTEEQWHLVRTLSFALFLPKMCEFGEITDRLLLQWKIFFSIKSGTWGKLPSWLRSVESRTAGPPYLTPGRVDLPLVTDIVTQHAMFSCDILLSQSEKLTKDSLTFNSKFCQKDAGSFSRCKMFVFVFREKRKIFSGEENSVADGRTVLNLDGPGSPTACPRAKTFHPAKKSPHTHTHATTRTALPPPPHTHTAGRPDSLLLQSPNSSCRSRWSNTMRHIQNFAVMYQSFCVMFAPRKGSDWQKCVSVCVCVCVCVCALGVSLCGNSIFFLFHVIHFRQRQESAHQSRKNPATTYLKVIQTDESLQRSTSAKRGQLVRPHHPFSTHTFFKPLQICPADFSLSIVPLDTGIQSGPWPPALVPWWRMGRGGSSGQGAFPLTPAEDLETLSLWASEVLGEPFPWTPEHIYSPGKNVRSYSKMFLFGIFGRRGRRGWRHTERGRHPQTKPGGGETRAPPKGGMTQLTKPWLHPRNNISIANYLPFQHQPAFILPVLGRSYLCAVDASFQVLGRSKQTDNGPGR